MKNGLTRRCGISSVGTAWKAAIWMATINRDSATAGNGAIVGGRIGRRSIASSRRSWKRSATRVPAIRSGPEVHVSNTSGKRWRAATGHRRQSDEIKKQLNVTLKWKYN